jgi:NADH:flavin oxidoreductase / NADH oxidase family
VGPKRDVQLDRVDIDTSQHSSPGSEFTALFRPGRIGTLELKNRVLMAPMEKNLCTANGVVTQRYIDYLVARARADVGLLRVEATYVDPVGKGSALPAGRPLRRGPSRVDPDGFGRPRRGRADLA